jgi:hypothetical protein
MKRFLALAPLTSWSPLVLAHPGHGTLSFADLWPLLTAALLIAIVGVIGLGRGGPSRYFDAERRHKKKRRSR